MKYKKIITKPRPTVTYLSVLTLNQRLSKFLNEMIEREGRIKARLAEQLEVNYKSFVQRLAKGNFTGIELLLLSDILNFDLNEVRDMLFEDMKHVVDMVHAIELNVQYFYKKECERKPESYRHLYVVDDVEYVICFNYLYDNHKIEVTIHKSGIELTRYTFNVDERDIMREIFSIERFVKNDRLQELK